MTNATNGTVLTDAQLKEMGVKVENVLKSEGANEKLSDHVGERMVVTDFILDNDGEYPAVTVQTKNYHAEEPIFYWTSSKVIIDQLNQLRGNKALPAYLQVEKVKKYIKFVNV